MYRAYTNKQTNSILTEGAVKACEWFMLPEAALPSPAAVLLPGRPTGLLQQQDARRLDTHLRIAALKGSQESIIDESGILRASRAGPGVY